MVFQVGGSVWKAANCFLNHLTDFWSSPWVSIYRTKECPPCRLQLVCPSEKVAPWGAQLVLPFTGWWQEFLLLESKASNTFFRGSLPSPNLEIGQVVHKLPVAQSRKQTALLGQGFLCEGPLHSSMFNYSWFLLYEITLWGQWHRLPSKTSKVASRLSF